MLGRCSTVYRSCDMKNELFGDGPLWARGASPCRTRRDGITGWES